MKVCAKVRSSKINFFGIAVSLIILLFSQINWAQKAKAPVKKTTEVASKVIPVQGMSLEQFLLEVKTHNAKAQALSLQMDASEDRRISGDIDLTPIAGANYTYLSDQSLPQSIPGTTKFLNKSSEVYLSKKFSTGTSAKLFAQGKEYEFVGASAAYPGKYATGGLGITVSQSLWKDFFGTATRLRQNRESYVAQLEKNQAEYQLRQLMTDAEIAYWNYLYKKEEKKQREASLERSSKILNWVKRRESDGISDRSDRFNSEALVSARQLYLLTSEDDLKSAEQAMRDYLSLDRSDAIPVISGNIAISRPIKGQFSKSQRVLRADAFLQLLESKAKKIVSSEVNDSMKPDLTLQASYKTNSYEEDLNTATNKWTETNKPTTTIGVQLTYMFDTSIKDSKSSAARKEAMASDLKAKKLVRESESAWTELLRKYDELSQKIALAENIKDFQLKRAQEEQMKLSRGRSVTNQVVTSEEDASNAELTVLQLKAEQRKLEAMTRSYFEVSESLFD